MKTLFLTFAILALSPAAEAQNLTAAQKEADFRYLASLYSTYYAPYSWKKQLFGFDLLDIKPWLARVAATTNDLDFYELCVEYVSSLNDTHDTFQLPSDFVARLGFTTDLYDGVLLIDSLNRTQLPANRYPFNIGDQLMSIDGEDALQLLDKYVKYAPESNPRAARRIAAARLTIRPQVVMPHAVDIGDSATVVIQRLNGPRETYTIPWAKTGTPLTVGPVPSPKKARVHPAAENVPDYMRELENARFSGVLNPELTGLNGYGARNPIFINALTADPNFTRRLGGAATDFFYSGTYKYEELTIGYIRIPNYAPPSITTALQQLDAEIAFFNANTHGLIVDEMRNTGGNLCFGENVAQRLIPYQFHATGFQLRPFWTRVLGFYNSMIAAKNANAPLDVVQQYELAYNEMLAANREGRWVTRELPLCTQSLIRTPAANASGQVTAYVPPVMMVIDEFSTSTADSVPGMFQDAGRGVLFGMRTNGAGGNNTAFDAGVYSEGVAGMTLALQTRRGFVSTPDFPTSQLIENVGVRPDVVKDYMTRDNLLTGGAPFVHDMFEAMAAYIRTR